MELEKAVKVLAKELRKDKGYFESWQANISVMFKDEMRSKGYEVTEKIHDIAMQAAENFLVLISAKSEDYMKVAEKLYKYKNPTSTMECPNSVYITTEKWYYEWQRLDTELGLFEWVLENKQ